MLGFIDELILLSMIFWNFSRRSRSRLFFSSWNVYYCYKSYELMLLLRVDAAAAAATADAAAIAAALEFFANVDWVVVPGVRFVELRKWKTSLGEAKLLMSVTFVIESQSLEIGESSPRYSMKATCWS